MLFRLVIILLFSCSLSSYGQTKLFLKNNKSNRQKEIISDDYIKIRFSSASENIKIFHRGKVVSFTDTTLAYLPIAFIPIFASKKDTIRIAFKNIIAIQKYKPIVNLALMIGIASGAGIGAVVAEEKNSKTAMLDIIFGFGALIIYQGVESRLVSPLRKVNQHNSVWQLVISP
jgi:uncharacterized membrane protein